MVGLISFFQQFFRHQPDGAISMATFDQTHLMLLALTTLGCMFIISDYYLIFKQEKFKKILAYTLLAQQAIMYAWHFSAGQHFDLAEALPLYNCRIAIFCAIIGLLTNNRIARLITIYWGIFGGIIALLIINPDQFLFPHWGYVSYFVGHIALLWTAVYFVKTSPRLNLDSLRRIAIITNTFHLIMIGFNYLAGTNYCYLNRLPLKSIQLNWPTPLYNLVVLLAFNVLLFIVFLALQKLKPTKLSTKLLFAKNII